MDNGMVPVSWLLLRPRCLQSQTQNIKHHRRRSGSSSSNGTGKVDHRNGTHFKSARDPSDEGMVPVS
jgi:hypothetical protein